MESGPSSCSEIISSIASSSAGYEKTSPPLSLRPGSRPYFSCSGGM